MFLTEEGAVKVDHVTWTRWRGPWKSLPVDILLNFTCFRPLETVVSIILVLLM